MNTILFGTGFKSADQIKFIIKKFLKMAYETMIKQGSKLTWLWIII
ncbi:MAG TPA: hypothetical protein VIY08_08320 [Candidatus Nitrosocosmicus sp.]